MAHEIPIKVRFCETDALGHISNISYFIYLEEARTEFFEHLGFQTEIDDWQVILASASCDFVNQGFYKQKLKVVTEISKIGNSSFSLAHRIEDAETGTIIANGKASAVHFNFETQRSERIPDHIRKELEKHQIKEVSHNEK
jgi:acyl-CoA thioester hydrolase